MNSAGPNILFVCADQWRGDCLGLYENQHPVMTPHLDQLAREGTLFTQAYSDCPTCMPQRLTWLTGKTGTELGCLSNFRREQTPEVDVASTLPSRLTRELGYQTKAIGKMHFGEPRSRYGFEHITLHPNDYINWLEGTPHAGGFRGHGLGGNEVFPVTATVPDSHYHTSWIVEQAVNFLDQRDPTCPFYLNLIFEAPHSPFDPPEPFDRMYDDFSIPDPVCPDWSLESLPGQMQNDQLVRQTARLSPELIRKTRRHYYGMVTNIDYHLGRLFGALQTRGLYHNTIIVFTSDHGEFLGDYGMWAKFNFLQAAARIPLIVKLAGEQASGQIATNDNPALTADIVPTLAEAVGLDYQSPGQATSLISACTSPAELEDRTIFGETPFSVMAKNKQRKYICFTTGGEEMLFDVQDGDETTPLTDESTARTLRAQVAEYLLQHESPNAADGDLVTRPAEANTAAMQKLNPWACRGPMRWGSGY